MDGEARAREKAKVLLDTDIGSDIDDALCLAYLLAHPDCELLGITTVTGEPERRAMLADAICRAAGRPDVPIHAGSARPLRVPQRQPSAPQAEILDRWPHRSDFPPDTAVDFLIQTVRRYPNEVTLLAIGPLTNVARMAQRDPDALRLLKALVLMNGDFGCLGSAGILRSERVEWNVHCDPDASAIIYDISVPLAVVGLNVTTRCLLPADVCRRSLQGGALEVVRELAEVYFRARPVVIFHDPLAAAFIFAPKLFEWRIGKVHVQLGEADVEGITVCDCTATGATHRVVVDVDVQGFFAHYFQIVGHHRNKEGVPRVCLRSAGFGSATPGVREGAW